MKRKIKGTIFLFLSRRWRWAVAMVIVIGALFFSLVGCNHLCSVKNRILADPFNPNSHLEFAELASENSSWVLAKGEFKIAALLIKKLSDSQVLGISSRFDSVSKSVFLQENLEKEADYWKQIVYLQPGYRDGYLQLALIYYRLSENGLALANFKQAQMLDPNHPDVQSVGKILGEGK